MAQGDYAYVTLRAGSFCGGGVNRLDILDITELTDPQNVLPAIRVAPWTVDDELADIDASYIPARRLLGVDPVAMLKEE